MAYITYPQMIAAFKTWYGQNKTRPSPTVEIDGQPAVRKASFGEMVTAGLTQLAVFATTAGFEFAKGGSDGLNKFLSSVPKEIGEPAKALVNSAGTAYNNFKDGITGSGGILENGPVSSSVFTDTLRSGLNAVHENFINPLGNIWDGFKTSLSGNSTDLENLSTVYGLQDRPLADLFARGANLIGTTVSNTIDTAKGWTDELTIGSDFTVRDAFDTINSGHTTFMATYLGIGEVPTITDFAGTLVKEDLIKNYSGAKKSEEEANLKLRQAAVVKFPTIDQTTEGGTTTVANPELEDPEMAAWYASLSESEKAAILADYDNRIVAYNDALDNLETATADISNQVKSDQTNVLLSMKAQTSVDQIGAAAQEYNSIKDPEQKALYEKTLKPEVLASNKQFAPLLAQTSSTTLPEIPSDKVV